MSKDKLQDISTAFAVKMQKPMDEQISDSGQAAGSVLDSERIDWLEGNNAEIHHGPDYVFVETDRHHEDRPTLREAIDVAMGEKPNNNHEA